MDGRKEERGPIVRRDARATREERELIRDGGSGITAPLGPRWKATRPRRPNIESGAATAGTDHAGNGRKQSP